MTGPSDWSDVSHQLTALQAAVAAAQQAALDSIGSSDADAFLQQLSALADTLATAQPALARALTAERPPGEVIAQVRQVGAAIEQLLTLNTRLSAQAQRALAVLFPQDQVKAYSRLGGKGLGTGGPGSGYLKA
ncbi:hypothetical protein [Tepidicella xavieri]|uniref:Flagellar protein FlgN n=1 Tax=Tepidicella xavieri TaxID=360241 RepID=A0A4R6U7P5_9BURK|nr:hypothetical protein [Tepidicella xavieri]TDQ40595.1 hypothetical protein DFR43_11644 [Tepidicella xavieri]